MLPSHALKVVLVEPEIPQNAGNVARLCAAVGAELHLVRPLGFFLTDRHFKRAGMDYLEQMKMVVHESLPALVLKIGGDPIVLTSGLPAGGAKAGHCARRPIGRCVWSQTRGFFWGKESAGLPWGIFCERAYPNAIVQIPMLEATRGLEFVYGGGNCAV